MQVLKVCLPAERTGEVRGSPGHAPLCPPAALGRWVGARSRARGRFWGGRDFCTSKSNSCLAVCLRLGQPDPWGGRGRTGRHLGPHAGPSCHTAPRLPEAAVGVSPRTALPLLHRAPLTPPVLGLPLLRTPGQLLSPLAASCSETPSQTGSLPHALPGPPPVNESLSGTPRLLSGSLGPPSPPGGAQCHPFPSPSSPPPVCSLIPCSWSPNSLVTFHTLGEQGSHERPAPEGLLH